MNNYAGKAVLITGGTMGIGRACGLAFGRAGAHVYLTHSWGSADEDEIKGVFAEAGATEPTILEADVSYRKDTQRLIAAIAEQHDRVEVFVSNVCVVPTTHGLDDLSRRAFYKSLEYCTWPMVGYVQQMKKVFDAYPRYVIGMSTDGVDHFYEGYDYVALTKSVMEVFCRYLAKRLGKHGTRVNCVRTRNVLTQSALDIHGHEYPDFVRRFASEHNFIKTEEVGDAVFALCSGLLDAMSGQVLSVDNGGPFADTLMRLFRHREEYGL